MKKTSRKEKQRGTGQTRIRYAYIFIGIQSNDGGIDVDMNLGANSRSLTTFSKAVLPSSLVRTCIFNLLVWAHDKCFNFIGF